MRSRLLAIASAILPCVAHGQTLVSGAVVDSISRKPLVGAVVQMVTADRRERFGLVVKSDSVGRFALADVPSGHYTLAFYHPTLDSLGIEPTLRDVQIDNEPFLRIDLAIPSPARLRAAICGEEADSHTATGVVVGIVRDARTHKPLPDATVTAEWLDLALKRTGMRGSLAHRSTRTKENGWFALCDVPGPGSMIVMAHRGADSTDAFELHVGEKGFARREFAVAAAHAGDGRLRGVVLSAEEGRPLAGARVGVSGGPQTRANERGEWSLTDAPLGTRTLEVRAVGYYPEQRVMDIDASSGSTSMFIVLSTVRSVLDTIRVRAFNLRAGDIAAFNERKHSGVGHYLTADDVEKRRPLTTSELFRSMPGVKMEMDPSGIEARILLRGNMTSYCSPAIFLNGRRISGSDGFSVPGITTDELDTWVRPHEIAGIEVYTGLGAPMEYRAGMRTESGLAIDRRDGVDSNKDSSCGSILIWMK